MSTSETKHVAALPALSVLEDEPHRLPELWEAYQAQAPMTRSGLPCCGLRSCTAPECQTLHTDASGFAAQVTEETDSECVVCVVCHAPHWEDDTARDVEDRPVCDSCQDDLTVCEGCDQFSVSPYFISVWMYSDRPFCQNCASNLLSYCSDCDEYYFNEDRGDHDHERFCECAPMPLEFRVPGNSHGPLEQDERLLVQFPEGMVSEEALEYVISILWSHQYAGLQYAADGYTRVPDAPTYQDMRDVVEGLDRVWQTRRGNFTKRLSSALYKAHKVTLNDGVLSRVGSAIRDMGGATTSWYVEFTRDLNQGPACFYHEDSCWFGGENQSLCALKHWGGFAMRSYSSEDQHQDRPDGRCWVQPLDENLQPTSDTLNAHAYVVYNGYGNLSGYSGARILAYLASKTYKKMPDFYASHQYVNAGGYMVADQVTCESTDSIRISGLDFHQSVPVINTRELVSA